MKWYLIQELINKQADEEEEKLRLLADEERRQQMKILEEKRLQEEKEKAREGIFHFNIQDIIIIKF